MMGLDMAVYTFSWFLSAMTVIMLGFITLCIKLVDKVDIVSCITFKRIYELKIR